MSLRLEALLKRKTGVLLDISLGGTPQEGSVTINEVWMANRNRKRMDLSTNPLYQPALLLPFPLPDASVHTAVVTHVLEYMDPRDFFTWWDELHRVLRPLGIVHLNGPYGGDESVGWLSDPQHRVRVIEETFAWLDPRTPVYQSYHASVGRPQPRPWTLQGFARVPGAPGTYSYNATLQSVPVKP